MRLLSGLTFRYLAVSLSVSALLCLSSSVFAEGSAGATRASFALGYAATDLSNYDPALSFKIGAEYFVDRRVAVGVAYHQLSGFDNPSKTVSTFLDFPAVTFFLSGYSDWVQKHRYFCDVGLYLMRVGGETSGTAYEAQNVTGFKAGFGYERELIPRVYMQLGAERYFSIAPDSIAGSTKININNFYMSANYEF